MSRGPAADAEARGDVGDDGVLAGRMCQRRLFFQGPVWRQGVFLRGEIWEAAWEMQSWTVGTAT